MIKQSNIFDIDEIYGMHEFCWNAAMIKTGVLKCIKRTKNDWKNTATDNNTTLELIKHQVQVAFNNYIKDKENIELKKQFDTMRDKYNYEFAIYQRNKINEKLKSIEKYDLRQHSGKVISYIAKLDESNENDGPVTHNGVIVTKTSDKCQAFSDHSKEILLIH